MKKIITILFLILSVVLYFWISSYTKMSFDYKIAQTVGYVFYWCFTLFVLSVFALLLNNNSYRKWLIVSLIVTVLSITIAYIVGDGSGGILSFDGKLITWFFVGLYSFVSLVYFVVQFVKIRKQTQIN